MLGQVPIFEILVQILMIIEYENSTVGYIYRHILHIVCITHISYFCNAYCNSPGGSAMMCDGGGVGGGGGEEIEIEISFSEVLLLNESAKQHILQGDLCAGL
jgi:hypothetical protein